MRHDYWVIRYVPDPIRGEFVNIGVIAGRGEDWSFRRVSNLRRAARLGGSPTHTDAFLKRIEDSIESRLDAVAARITADRPSLFGKGDVEDLRVRMNNLVQLSDARPVLANSASEAVDMAFELMVVDSEGDVQHRSRTRVVRRLRAAFDVRPELMRHVARSHVAAVGQQETGIDFAVTDGIVHQMSQVWAFDVKDTRNLQTQIQAWNYLLGLLRADGGQLMPRSGRNGLIIPSDVDVNAVFAAPVTSEGEAQFAVAEEGWRRLGVEVVPASESERVIDEAERLLAAASS
jgi:hypothetical protein